MYSKVKVIGTTLHITLDDDNYIDLQTSIKTFVISVVAFEIFTIKDQTFKVDVEQEVQGRQGKYYTGIVSTCQ